MRYGEVQRILNENDIALSVIGDYGVGSIQQIALIIQALDLAWSVIANHKNKRQQYILSELKVANIQDPNQKLLLMIHIYQYYYLARKKIIIKNCYVYDDD